MNSAAIESQPIVTRTTTRNAGVPRGGTAARDAATREQIAERHFDAMEFADFVREHYSGPRSDRPEWGPHELTDWQIAEARALLVTEAAGRIASVLWIVSWPRRHGKTQFVAMYIVARAALYPNQTIVVEANSEDQAQETVFRWCADLVTNSTRAFVQTDRRGYRLEFRGAWAARPALDIEIVDGEIRFANGSTITLVTTGQASSFGRRLSVYVKTELHASPQESTFHAGAGSTGDSWCGLTIVDSTQGEEGSLLHRMTEDGKLAAATGGKEGDPACAVSHVHYQDIDRACEGGLAPWISAQWLRSMARRMPWSDFRRNHLNLATSGGASVFPHELLRRACTTPASALLCTQPRMGWRGVFTGRDEFRALRRMFRGHGLRIGMGLDRSMGVLGGDRTIAVVGAVGVDESRVGALETEYDADGAALGERECDPRVHMVLAIVEVPRGAGGVVKRLVKLVSRLYGEPTQRYEAYQAKDLAEWAEGEGFDARVCAMTAQAKATHVQRFCELLGETRISLPACALDARGHAGLLYAELGRYQEIERRGALPSYGGVKGTAPIRLDTDHPDSPPRPVRVKDDTVEAMFWAIDANWDTDPNDDGGLSL